MSDIDNIENISDSTSRYRSRIEKHLRQAEAAFREFVIECDYEIEKISAAPLHLTDIRFHLITNKFVLEVDYPLASPGRIHAVTRMTVTPFKGIPVCVALRREIRQQLGELASENLIALLRKIGAWVINNPVDDKSYVRSLSTDLIEIRPTYDGTGADIGGFLDNGDPIQGHIRIWIRPDHTLESVTELFEQTSRDPVFVSETEVDLLPSNYTGFFRRLAIEALTKYLATEN